MRFCHFNADEIMTLENPFLDMEVDPKLAWALRNMHVFPVDINKADYELVIRVPGIGIQSGRKIIAARMHQRLSWEHLRKIGVSVHHARYFAICNDELERKGWQPRQIRQFIISLAPGKYKPDFYTQLTIF
jgi:predicted DNA-binding helix-hairpin-helix protein